MTPGPLPKPASQRARRNRDRIEHRTLETAPAAQPPLPDDRSWPDATRRWWQAWGESPLATDLDALAWCELLIAASLHAEVSEGDLRFAGELRLRVAKFGATPEDRARLRITFTTPAPAPTSGTASTIRDRHPDLRLVDGET